MGGAARTRSEAGVGSSAVLTAASTLAAMGLGAAIAVLVLLLFGAGARTDAFFAAYGAYAVLVAGAQGLRVALVARLLEASGWRPLDRFVSGVLLLGASTAVPMLVLGQGTARLLVGELGPDAVAVARQSLALLWAAGSLQLLGGVLAAALAARGRFGAPAAAYTGGAVVTVVSVLVLAGPMDVQAVAAAVALGSAVVAGVQAVCLVRTGWRWRPVRSAVGSLGQLLGGSVPQLTVQAAFLLSVAGAARLGPGEVTAYSYAFFAALLMLGATAGPATMVLAGPLAARWDRRPRSLEPELVAVTQASLVLLVPVVAAVALVGEDALRLLLAGPLDAAAARSITTVLLALSGFVALTAAAAVPTVACFALGAYARVAVVCLVALVAHAGTTALAVGTGRLSALGLAASTTAGVLLVGLVVLVSGRDSARPLALLAACALRVGAVGVVAFAPAAALRASGAGAGAAAAGLVVGLVLHVLLVRRVLPATYGAFRRVGDQVVGRRRARAPRIPR